MVKKEKVLLVVSQIEGNGGIPRFNRNLIDALLETNVELVILTLVDDHSDNEVVFTAGGNRLIFVLKYLFLVISFRPNKAIIGLLNFVPFSIFLKPTKIRVFVVLHGVEAWYRRRKLIPFFKYVDKFLAVSNYTKLEFSRTNDIPPHRISKIFNTLPKDWETSDNPVMNSRFFLSVTRLDKEEGYKGVDKTILAVESVQSWLRLNSWRYVIVAKGTDLSRHKSLVAKEGLSDLIEFKEGIDDHELKDLYRECSFFILPSSGEGFGIVFLEAMIYGKPCVGCKNCGTEDVIEDGKTGFLIDQNIEEIKTSILYLTAEKLKSQKMGYEGKERFFSDFAFHEFKSKIIEELCVE